MRGDAKTPAPGFILCELVLSMALSFLVTLLALSFVRSLALLKHERYRQESLLLDRTLLDILSRRVIHHLDSHRLPLYPRIHSNGDLRFASGNSVFGLTGTKSLSPNKHSDAISSVSLGMASTLRVTSCTSDGESLTAQACSLSARPPQLSKIRNILLISPEALRVHAATLRGSGRCRRVIVHGGESLFDSEPLAPLSCSVSLMVPVLELDTLVIDTRGTLRLLRHEGARLIENQPLHTSANFAEDEFRLETVRNDFEFQLQYRFKPHTQGSGRRALNGSITPVLARQAPNYLSFNF